MRYTVDDVSLEVRALDSECIAWDTSSMTIQAYCKLHSLSAAEFGRRVGVGRAVAARWVKGEDEPRGPNIRKVVEATRGEVTANDILGIGVMPPPAAEAAAPASDAPEAA